MGSRVISSGGPLVWIQMAVDVALALAVAGPFVQDLQPVPNQVQIVTAAT